MCLVCRYSKLASRVDVQIGDMRGLGGLVELLWHQLEIKLGVYDAKVTSCNCICFKCTYQKVACSCIGISCSLNCLLQSSRLVLAKIVVRQPPWLAEECRVLEV